MLLCVLCLHSLLVCEVNFKTNTYSKPTFPSIGKSVLFVFILLYSMSYMPFTEVSSLDGLNYGSISLL